jgi:hypothetical protein
LNRGEILITIRPAVGEAAEEGLADVTEEEEEREDSVGLAAASRVIRRLIRRAFKIARPGEVCRPAFEPSIGERQASGRTRSRFTQGRRW